MTARDQHLLHTIALTLVPNVGSVLAQNLIAYCGSAEEVFRASKKKLMSIPLVGEDRATAIIDADVMKLAEAEMKFISDHRIEPLIYTDAAYPKRLKECTDMPIILYYRGTVRDSRR